MKTNRKSTGHRKTHEGAPARNITIEQELRRSLLACLLWENTFYESGVSIADRIKDLASKCNTDFLASLAVEARTQYRLRHAPLLLLLELAKRGGPVAAKAIEDTINRPDEITELVAMYWSDGRKMLPRCMRQGLSAAFNKFDEYQLAKYNQPNKVKLRDVLFLCHAKPTSPEREALFKKLAENELSTPDTWESRMAAGQDKKEVFTDLIKRNKLGFMALLRNLRGMTEAGVDENLIKNAIVSGHPGMTLPFRFVSAAKHAPKFEAQLNTAMKSVLDAAQKLPGKTALLVDVSGSMQNQLSGKSELRRYEAAGALAILLAGICEDFGLYMFGTNCKQIAPRTDLSLMDTLRNGGDAVGHGTRVGNAVRTAGSGYDRIIVITDEQSHDSLPSPKGTGYVINVASYQNGIGYGKWVHIDGFSEAVVKFIQESEAL